MKTMETKRGNNMSQISSAVFHCHLSLRKRGAGEEFRTVDHRRSKLRSKGLGEARRLSETPVLTANVLTLATLGSISYTGTCSVPGNCSCGVLTSATVTGSGLKSVANFFVTSDQGFNPATAPTVDSGPNPECNLFLGTFTVTDKSSNVTTLNFLGVSCKHVTGTTSSNPGERMTRIRCRGVGEFQTLPCPLSRSRDGGRSRARPSNLPRRSH